MSRQAQTAICPRCGQAIELRPHPDNAGRVIGDCECNLGRGGEYRGPVIETNAEQYGTTEVKDDSTIS